jgi:nucleoside-diphosphate-sugar epimerase
MKHICITGYNSFIGKNFYRKYKKIFKIFPYKKNINNLNEIKKFIQNKKITHLVNFAGLSRSKCKDNRTECLNTNYKSIIKIINYLNKLNNKPHFVFISSSHVYNYSKTKLKETSKTNPKNTYAKIKLRSENYIKKNYKNYTIIRLFNIYGSNQPKNYFIPDIKEKIKKGKIINIDKSIRDFIHVSEVSKIIKFIINNNINETINIGSGKGYSLIKIVKYLSKKLKRKPIVNTTSNKTKLVADISLLKSYGFKTKKNEKYINF